jgi:hypothetical protein
LIALGVVTLATLGTALAVATNAHPRAAPAVRHHLDGDGPLASTGDPHTTQSFAFDPTIAGPTWTVGIPLCIAQAKPPLTLDGYVAGTRTVGRAFRVVGTYVRRFTPTRTNTPIMSANGFPPAVSDSLHSPSGFQISDPCQFGPNPSRSMPYDELLVGIGRVTPSDDGGGWMGVDIGYSMGGRHYVVSLGYDILICGRSVGPPYCAQ